ncbi:MAG: hypothetical protein IT567_04085, partial [Alphaproteobacteria bacterium]|nr:hypothetical protein [Alphaproteobacteria bacterium]
MNDQSDTEKTGHWLRDLDEKVLSTRAGTQASVTVGATAVISLGAVLMEKQMPQQIEQVKAFFTRTIANLMNPIDALAEKLSGHHKTDAEKEQRNRKWGNLVWDSGVISLLGALWIIPTHMRSHAYENIRENMAQGMGRPEAEQHEKERFKQNWHKDILGQFVAFVVGTVGGTGFLNFTRTHLKPDAPEQLVKNAETDQQPTPDAEKTADRAASWIANNL